MNNPPLSPDLEDEPVLLSEPTPQPSFLRKVWVFPIKRILVYFLVVAGISYVLGEATAFTFRTLHIHLKGNRQATIATGESVFAATVILALLFMVRFVDRRPMPTSGLTLRTLPKGLSVGFVFGGAIMSLVVGTLWALGIYRATAFTPSLLLLPPILLYLMVGVSEELLFRGYIFQTLEGRWGSGVALIVTCVFFGLTHLGNPTPGEPQWQHWIGPVYIILEAGILLAAAYLLTRSWWFAIGIHCGWDYFEGVVYGCPDSGTHDPHTLFHANIVGNFFESGGAFGPEASLVTVTIATIVGLVVLRTSIRKGNWKPLRQPTPAQVELGALPSASSSQQPPATF